MFEGNNEFLSHIDTCKNRLTPENSVCVVTPPVAPTASTHTSNANIAHLIEGNDTREYLKRVLNETLMGGVQRRREPEWDPDYWMKERREVVYNRGKFSPRSWEGTTYNGTKRGEDTDMGLDSVDLHDEGELIVDVDNNVDSSQSDEAHHQPM